MRKSKFVIFPLMAFLIAGAPLAAQTHAKTTLEQPPRLCLARGCANEKITVCFASTACTSSAPAVQFAASSSNKTRLRFSPQR
jgi:hypothetical protein